MTLTPRPEPDNCASRSLPIPPPGEPTRTIMIFQTPPMLLQSLRKYSHRAGSSSRADRLGAATVMGYCCIAFSAPFAGAAVVSRQARRDKRYANMYAVFPIHHGNQVMLTLLRRPLSFRDCLPGSPLEDYAGLRR